MTENPHTVQAVRGDVIVGSCSECNGEGRVWDHGCGHGVTCWTCRGRGFVQRQKGYSKEMDTK